MNLTRDNRSRLSVENNRQFDYSNNHLDNHLKVIEIDHLFIPTMIKNPLLKAGILQIGDLLKYSLNDIAKLDGIGKVTLNMIENLIYEVLFDPDFEKNFVMKDIFTSKSKLSKKAVVFSFLEGQLGVKAVSEVDLKKVEQFYINISNVLIESINALEVTERDRTIYLAYLSYDNANVTLNDFSKQWDLSTERVRQILNMLTYKLDKKNIRKEFNEVPDHYKQLLFTEYFYPRKGLNYSVGLIKILYFKSSHLDRLTHEFKSLINVKQNNKP